MVLKVKPKIFGPVFVSFDGSAQLNYAYGDPSGLSPHPPAGTPMDTLIASLGSCIVRSVEWVAGQRKTPLNPFLVKVVGSKSLDLPGRMDKAEITIIGAMVDDAELAPQILKQAKSICTVSNSLTTKIEIGYEPA